MVLILLTFLDLVETELLPPPLPPPPPPKPPRIEQKKRIAEVKEKEIPKQPSRDPTPAPPTPQVNITTNKPIP